MSRILKKEKVDIVHSNNWGCFVESVAAKWIAKTPLIIHTQHGMEMNDSEAVSSIKRFIRNRIRQFASYCTGRIIVVSKATWGFAKDDWRISAKKINLIYNGININEYVKDEKIRETLRSEIGIAKDDFVIGSVGRLMRVKNYPYLVKTFHSILKTSGNVKLLIVGEGPEKNEINSLVKKFNIADKVKLLGTRSDIKEILNVMDVFALPSLSEGISISILEAMSSCLPVVVTNVGGNSEIIENGENGFLVSVDNYKEMVCVIQTLIKDPKKREVIGLNGRERVKERFTLDRMIKNYKNLYMSLYLQRSY